MTNSQDLSGTNAQLNELSSDQLKIDPFSAQTWLDETYPIEKRRSVKKIGHNGEKLLTFFSNVPKNLTGKFINFKGFTNLTELNLPYRKITLESIVSFPISLQILQLASNSFPSSNLAPFSHLINLIKLDIGTIGSKIDDHNKWYGSLIYLKEMKNLNWLCLGTTDIDCGLEYLPKHKFVNLGFNSDFPHSKCLNLRKILKLINYDLNLFNSNFYNEDYLNAQQLLHNFKSIVKEIKDISKIGSGRYSDIQNSLKKSEINLDKAIENIVDFINKFEDKNSEIKRLSNELIISQSEIKLIKKNEVFEENFIHTNFILSFRKIQVFILKSKLDKINQSLLKERNNIEYLSAKLIQLEIENKELTTKYNEERLNKNGTLFLNSHFGSYLIKELNKFPMINIEEEHIKSLNTAFFLSNFAGYSKLQKYSIYFIIITFAFMIFAYLLKLFTTLFFNALNFFIIFFKAINKTWKLIFSKKKDELIEIFDLDTNESDLELIKRDLPNTQLKKQTKEK